MRSCLGLIEGLSWRGILIPTFAIIPGREILGVSCEKFCHRERRQPSRSGLEPIVYSLTVDLLVTYTLGIHLQVQYRNWHRACTSSSGLRLRP